MQSTITRLPTAALRPIKQPNAIAGLAEAAGLPRLDAERRKRARRGTPRLLAEINAPGLALSALVYAMTPSRKEAKACRKNTTHARARLASVGPDAAPALDVLSRRCSVCGWCKAHGLSVPIKGDAQ